MRRIAHFRRFEVIGACCSKILTTRLAKPGRGEMIRTCISSAQHSSVHLRKPGARVSSGRHRVAVVVCRKDDAGHTLRRKYCRCLDLDLDPDPAAQTTALRRVRYLCQTASAAPYTTMSGREASSRRRSFGSEVTMRCPRSLLHSTTDASITSFVLVAPQS